MNIDLDGKTALVTGSTEGIGYAIARRLLLSGARVVVNGRQSASVEKAVHRLVRECGPVNVTGVASDVGTQAGCEALASEVGSVDILINNVGIYGPEDFFEIGDDSWSRIFEINVMSGVRLSRALIPAMIRQAWGRVLFVSSESALNIPPEMIHYGFSKTANLSVSRGLAKRVAGTGVTVNAILPGPTLTEGMTAMLDPEGECGEVALDQRAKDFVMAHRPGSLIERAATPDEVANLAVYAVSPLASATSGAALRVDGGVVDTIA